MATSAMAWVTLAFAAADSSAAATAAVAAAEAAAACARLSRCSSSMMWTRSASTCLRRLASFSSFCRLKLSASVSRSVTSSSCRFISFTSPTSRSCSPCRLRSQAAAASSFLRCSAAAFLDGALRLLGGADDRALRFLLGGEFRLPIHDEQHEDERSHRAEQHRQEREGRDFQMFARSSHAAFPLGARGVGGAWN